MDYIDARTLKKVSKAISPIGDKAEFKLSPSDIQDGTKGSLIKIFLYGLAKKSDPSFRPEIIKHFTTLLLSKDGLKTAQTLHKFYVPILEKATEAEIESILAPQMVLLIKRSKESFVQIAPILKSVGKVTCKSITTLIRTTLYDLIAQEANSESLLIDTLKHLARKITNAEDEKEYSAIIEVLSYPWKQQLGASEVEAKKQLKLVKILAVFFAIPKGVQIGSKKTLLSMMIEMHGAIKQDQVSAESAVILAEGLKTLPESLFTTLYEVYGTHILSKAFVAAKSKDLMAAMLYPIISHGVMLVSEGKDQIVNYLPGLTRSAWRAQVSQLNLNAVTQSAYNTAVLSLQFLLEFRDQFKKPKEEEKVDTGVKFALGPSNINKRDFILQKLSSPLDGLLHLYLITLSAAAYPTFVESQSHIIPTIVNILVQYSFSPTAIIRQQAVKLTRALYHKYAEFADSEIAWLFSKDYQMAVYAFLKHTISKEYASHIKPVLGVMKTMLEATKGDEKISTYFVRLFILMHNAKAAGIGRDKRKLVDQVWPKLGNQRKEWLKRTARAILRYLTSGNSIMVNGEGALVAEDQVQTILNVAGTMAREGLGKEVLETCKELLSKDKLIAAEDLYSAVIEEGGDFISRFEYEFLADEIKDLKMLQEAGVTKEKIKEEKKPVKPAAKKPSKKPTGKKPAKEEGPTKEERAKEHKQIVEKYVKGIVERVRTETKNALALLKVLCKEWHSKDLIKEAINVGLVTELKGIINVPSTRFEGYITLHHLLACLTKDSDNLSEAYFASTVNLTSRKYVKACIALFTILFETKIETFDASFIAIVLDIAEFLVGSTTLPSSIKSKVVEVVIRIILEAAYDSSVIHRITPIVVKVLESSYQSENLLRFLQVFWTRALYNDMQDVIKNMWNYDYSHQISLIHAIYMIKRPLPDASWISNTMLQSLFNENNDMATLAKGVMNERTLRLCNVLLEEDKPSSLIKMLNFKAKDVRDSAVRAIAGYLELRQSQMSTAVKLFINEYENLDFTCKGTIADLFKATAHILPSTELKSVFTFLLTKGVAEPNEVAKEFMDSGIQIIQAQGKAHAGIIITAIEDLINQGKKVLTDNANTIAVIFIGNVARYLAKEDPKLPKLYKTLQGMLTIKSEEVNIAVAKCISYFASIFQEEAKEKIAAILSSFQKTDAKTIPTPATMKSQAFALAGYVKGLGVKSIDDFEVMKVLEEPFKEKASDSPLSLARKENSLYAYAALSHTLGKTFEFHAVGCMPYILQSFAVGKENVRQAAQQASKSIISKLSGQGVKSILPKLVDQLDTVSWRSKLAAVECLGSMAFMAPKQLSNYLPMIVSNIKVVLNDTQPKVHEAGIRALTAIGSVIKNPEIADISGHIIQALKNPTKELIYALDLLLQQRFAHAIDAPSLSLIIPILDYGLRAQNNDVKMKATQLVGNICKLIANPNDMVPYLPVVIPALKSALFDAIPEIRSASAKAMGALCKGLGLENMQEVVIWLKSIIQKEGSPVERSGAAQGYAEIIAEQGTEYLEGVLDQLIEHTRDKSSVVREGYFGVFLFLPLSFGEAFEKYFTLILPVVLEALTDQEEQVRSTANRVVQICIRQYGKKRTDVLLEPLFHRMLDNKWKIRESALGLMADLLLVIENDMTRGEPQYISPEERDRILAILYILRYDNVDSIRVTAAQIWKGFIDNQPKALRAIMPTLIGEILELVAKRAPELKEIGIYTLHDLAEKYGEKLTLDILKIFKERIEVESEGAKAGAGDEYVEGIAVCLYEMLRVLDYKIATEHKWKVYNILEPFIGVDDDDLRTTVAGTFAIIMHKDLDNDFQLKLAKIISSRLLEYEEAQDTEKHPLLQDTIRLITRQRTKFGDDIVRILREEPLTPMKISTFTAISQYLVTVMFTQYRAKKVLEQLFQTALLEGGVHDATISFFQRCTELFATEDEREKWVSLWIDFIAPSDKRAQRARAYLKVVTYMFKEVKDQAYISYNKELFENVVGFIDLDVDEVPLLVTEAIDAITKIEAKENQHAFVSRIKREIDNKCRKDYLLPIFNRQKSLDNLLPLFQNTLIHASVELRVDAAAAYRYVIELTDQNFLKNYAAKIAGSLIRVVNDKFPLVLKNELLECTCALMRKSGASIKAFVSPIQTTLMKAVNDPELSSSLKPVILKNVGELLKLTPKTDSLRMELMNTVNSPVTATHATSFGVLAMIGKIHGATTKPEVRATTFSQITGYLAKLAPPVDESNVAGAAFALASLCHTSQEAHMLLDLVMNKYQGRPEISSYLLFGALFTPFGSNEPGSKFVSNLLGKVKLPDKSSLARTLVYIRFFITGINPLALEEVLKIMEEWVENLDSIGWDNAIDLLNQFPFTECEEMKVASESYQKLKGNTARYIAKECELVPKDGAKDLVKVIIGEKDDPVGEIKKMQEAKIIDEATAEILISLFKQSDKTLISCFI
eukprot:TRINITY_DN135344_c2_g1_i1.p1 TRINITY_DN135344_c2_g1~~TRINITY_DN135344_c2_g1_i1.p1  ORF type:complete len:2658 (-),score=295.29 TRINITY_DN135344_c2_g1_i1:34-7386(-)